MPVFRLGKGGIYFPNPQLAEEDGLLAVGGDLSVERLLLAYGAPYGLSCRSCPGKGTVVTVCIPSVPP